MGIKFGSQIDELHTIIKSRNLMHATSSNNSHVTCATYTKACSVAEKRLLCFDHMVIK